MSKISILFILVSTLASFGLHSNSQISEMSAFKSAFDSPESKPSIENVAMARELNSHKAIEKMAPNSPVSSDVSFSAMDGSRPLLPALQSPDLKNSYKNVTELKKRLPSIYIEKYFE